MIRKSQRILGFLLGSALLCGSAAAATAILPLSQVKPGMKGKGRSVFAGTKVEEFDVEVIGLLANTQAAKRNVILARLSGRGLEATGVVGGMSGSPVYVDGKIIGAVAFSFSYAKEPIAGITPIEEMLADGREPRATPRTGFSLEAPIRESMTLEDLAGLYRSALQARQAASSGEQAVVPLGVPLVFGGFSSWAYEKAKPFFADIGFRPVRSGSAGQVLPGQKTALPASIQEGDAVGVQLIGGDLDLTAVGTATYVDGNRVVAFGHPLYNLGGVDYAMTKATVLTVVPSLESSFKLAASGPVIGRFSQDRTSGVTGQIGLTPRLIPLNITIQGDSPERREFKLKIVDDKFLSPALVNMAVSSLITAEERAYGNLSLEFNGDIFLDKGASLHLEDLFSGNYDTSATSLSSLLAAVVYYLNNNEFRDVGIYRIDLNVKALEETRQCFLEKVLLDKYEVSPGEKIGIKVFLRTAKEESLAEDITLVAPPLPAGSDFQIVIGDAASMQQVERSQYRIQEFVPRSLAQLLRILGNLRKNNRVYFKVLAAKPGLFLKGEELPNLPPTLKAMFASPRASSPPATELTRSTLTEYQLPLPYVFRGGAVIPVKIRR